MKTGLWSFALCSCLLAHSLSADEPLEGPSQWRAVFDPMRIERYTHEEMVNSFLGIQRKFGISRFIVIHNTNSRLLRHGGTTTVPLTWNSKSTEYRNVSWAMIGDVNTPKPLVHYLDQPRNPAFENLSDVILIGGDGKPLPPEKVVESIRASMPAIESTALKTREPDMFELWALARLKLGEPLVSWEKEHELRMVGPIRAGAQCLDCHPGSRADDVLGAFTYEFSKTKHTSDPFATNTVAAAVREGKSLAEMAAIVNPRYGNPDVKLTGRERYSAEEKVRRTALATGTVLPEMLRAQEGLRKALMTEDLKKQMGNWEEFRRTGRPSN